MVVKESALLDHGEMPASFEDVGCQVRRDFPRAVPLAIGTVVVIAAQRQEFGNVVAREPWTWVVVRNNRIEKIRDQLSREMLAGPRPVNVVRRIVELSRAGA